MTSFAYLVTEIQKANKVDCLIWPHWKNRGGYGQLSYGNVKTLAHRLAWELHNKERAVNDICHSCDTPACFNPFHLWHGTRLENMQDAAVKKRVKQYEGEQNRSSKLKAFQVLEIRKELEKNSYAELAQKYGVGVTTIYNIAARISWRNI